jgi:hypothetical protein
MKAGELKSFVFTISLIAISYTASAQVSYQGKPWHDTIQSLPGKLECEKYDAGGEGVAYHDKDSVNNGSGKLNPNDGTFFNTFRINEGVDISYTKVNGIDDTPYNFVKPLMKQLYVGWTEPGEWVKYTIDVTEDGFYEASLMYTSRYDGKIALDVDGKEWIAPVTINSTFNQKDTIAWRQWHHWNKEVLATGLLLTKGKHCLTLRTVEQGNMNYDYIEFKKSKSTGEQK